MAKPKETKEIKLLKSLFRKKNLEERFIFIPEYAQPMTFLALELDETLHEIVCMLCYIGEDIHLKEFKKFLLNYKVFKIENGALVDLTPTASKDDYNFIGWNTNKDATTSLTSLTVNNADITLYAIFAKEIHLVESIDVTP